MLACMHRSSEVLNTMESIPLDGPIDLAALDDFLASDRTPPDCMQLSELDGFLAGIVAGPQMIPPSSWLSIIWRGDAPKLRAQVEGPEEAVGTKRTVERLR